MRARGVEAVFASRRRWMVVRRAFAVLAGGLGLVLLYVLVGLIPVNRGFVASPDGVEVSVISSAVHADVILPIVHGDTDWRAWLGEDAFARGWPAAATHLAIGWGDRGFFLDTPTWSDLRPGTAARALLWPSETCMHVSLTRTDWYEPGVLRSVVVSGAQHAALVRFVRDSFRKGAGDRPRGIEGAAYGGFDAFYDANRRYHAARNCNNWAGSALRAAGVRVPWYTPVPKSMLLYLP